MPYSDYIIITCINPVLPYGSWGYNKTIYRLIKQSPEGSDLVRIYYNQTNMMEFNVALKVLASMSPIEDSRNRKDSVTIRDENVFENIIKEKLDLSIQRDSVTPDAK